MPLSGVFETTDGALVLVGAFKANPLRDICAALGLPDLSLDARFANLDAAVRAQGRAAGACSASASAANTREHWLARLEEQDLLCAPVRDMREALVDRRPLHNGMVDGGPEPRRHSRCASSPADRRCRPRRSTLRRAPPRLGEHTDEILAWAAPAASPS